MTESRLERLFKLLDSASTPAFRRLAAKQLGSLAAAEPSATRSFLAAIDDGFLASKTWDTRIAAAYAVEYIFRAPGNKSHFADISTTVEDRALLLTELDLTAEIDARRPLLASAGTEFDLDLTISAAERLRISRANMKRTLGLDEVAIAEMDALGRELVKDEDLAATNGSGLPGNEAAQQSAAVAATNLEQMSARERSVLKRKARLQSQARKMVKLTEPSSSGTSTGCPSVSVSGSTEAGSLEAAGLEAIENDAVWLCERMKGKILSPHWTVRHGAVLGLRAVLQVGLPRFEDGNALAEWIELLLADVLLILGLDRFGDFVGEQVVSPVKETAAQLFALVFRFLPPDGHLAASLIDRHLVALLTANQWQVRHGGLLAVKYLLAGSDGRSSGIASALGSSICGLLGDLDEDVRAVAAEILSLLFEAYEHDGACANGTGITGLMGRVSEALAETLRELEQTSSSAASIIELLGHVVRCKGASEELVKSLPLALVPFVRHPTTRVRSRVLVVYDALPSECLDNAVFGQLLQSLALETDEAVGKATLELWRKIAATLTEQGQDAFSTRFMEIVGTPLGHPYDPSWFEFAQGRQQDHELAFKKSDMMLVSETEAMRQRINLAQALAVMSNVDEGVLQAWSQSPWCLHHLILHWIRPGWAPAKEAPRPEYFAEELGVKAVLQGELNRLSSGRDPLAGALAEAAEEALRRYGVDDALQSALVAFNTTKARTEARFMASKVRVHGPEAVQILLKAVSLETNFALQEAFAREFVQACEAHAEVGSFVTELKNIAQMASLQKLADGPFVYENGGKWTAYSLPEDFAWRGAQLIFASMADVAHGALLRRIANFVHAQFDGTWMASLLVGLMKACREDKESLAAFGTSTWLKALVPLVSEGSTEPWIGASVLALAVKAQHVTSGTLTDLETFVTESLEGPAIPVMCVILELLQVAESVAIPLIPVFLRRVMASINDQDAVVRQHASLAFSQLIRLAPLQSVAQSEVSIESPKLRALIDTSRGFLEHLQGPPTNLPDFIPPCPIRAELRPYQQAGLNWLAFLRRFRLHGALCDDMGLGKTLQTLCIIASDHWEEPGGRSLVVCPASLVGHWEAETRLYCPSLKAPLVYIGSAAERRASLLPLLGDAELVITSYEVMRADSEHFAALRWRYCVLDEGHLIKNPRTKLSTAVRTLRAEHRLILSGTPIQNSLLELWALFDFLLPGYLGSEKEFADAFARPILVLQHHQQQQPQTQSGVNATSVKWTLRDFEDAEKRLAMLHKQVLPFILRRMKEDVLKDLPPKIIQDYTCAMSSVQKIIYEDLLKSTSLRTDVSSYIQSKFRDENGAESETLRSSTPAESITAAKSDAPAQPPMHVFQALQYLRKLCIHPSLVLETGHPLMSVVDDELKRQGWNLATELEVAPKFLMLKELLIECGLGRDVSEDGPEAAERHRVLIFAQHKHTLDLVERLVFRAHLPHLSYLRLDGSVEASARYPIVSKFNADPTIDVLLLTTHVGGLGLNLTAADTVIFMDPDWNPSRDLQAMDRAHRLGQKRVVNVYRLLLKDSLEERIMGLQRWKMLLASSVVSQQNASLATMDTGNVLDLFESRGKAEASTCASNASGAEESSTEQWLKRQGASSSVSGGPDDYESEYAGELGVSSFLNKANGDDQK